MSKAGCCECSPMRPRAAVSTTVAVATFDHHNCWDTMNTVRECVKQTGIL